MAEKLADFGISVEVENDDLLLFGDAIEKVQKGVWTTSDALDYLKAQVQQCQEAVNRATEGSEEWQEATKKLNQAQEELAASKLPSSRIEMHKASEAAKKLSEDEKRAAQEAENASKRIQNLTRSAVLFLGHYIAIKKSFTAVMGFAREGEELARMAQLAGTSAESIQKLGIALKNYGGSASSASSTLSKLNQQMEDLKFGKGGKLGQAAIRYGLNINASSPEQMLMNIAQRMEGLKPLQQLNLGRMLGLDNATILMLQQGVEGVALELEKAGKLTVFTKEDIENTQKMQRAYREFQEKFDKLKASIERGFLPIFQTLFERLGKLADYLKEQPELLKIVGATATLVFGTMFLNPVVALTSAIVLLIDDLNTFLEGGNSLLNWDNPLLKFFRWLLVIIKGCLNLLYKLAYGIGAVFGGATFKEAAEMMADDNVHLFENDDFERLLGISQNQAEVLDKGQSYVSTADTTPINSMTSTQMTMRNQTDSHNKTNSIYIANMTMRTDNPEKFGQTLVNEVSSQYCEPSL